MYRLLLDANISPETASFLRTQFGFDVESMIELEQGYLDDEQVVKMAQKSQRIIVTLDLDFGELYHEQVNTHLFGVIIIRLRDQRVESINATLARFFSGNKSAAIFTENPMALVVMDEYAFRVVL